MTSAVSLKENDHTRLAAYVLWALVPLPALSAWSVGNPVLPVLVISLGFAAATWLARRVDSAVRSYVIAVGLIGQAGLLTAALAGHPWQIDTHMLFFALLAVVSTMRSISSLILACGLTAAHHLGLTLLMPALVYPSADLLTNVGRTALHGAIVVVEGGILFLSMREAQKQRAALLEQKAEAMDLTEQAHSAREAAQRVSEEITEVVGWLRDGLADLAKGDLTRTFQSPFPAEYESLRGDYNATVIQLRDLIGAVAGNASEIHLRAEELSVGSFDLSRRTEAQAVTLEETAAALEEMSANVSVAAEGTRKVEQVVEETRDSAEQSGQVVMNAIAAMSEIKRSSDEINQIIGVIDDIAFQTNLLALNAGVEAARAGESGRGFAVVASEVRALAQRSAESASEIKDLISASTGYVENGVSLVDHAGQALNDIVKQVGRIATMTSDIANGSQEQSAGLSELNTSVAQLDQVTQQNAAMVEESTAASTTLKNEAETLRHLVSRFRIDADETAPMPSDDTGRPDPFQQVA